MRRSLVKGHVITEVNGVHTRVSVELLRKPTPRSGRGYQVLSGVMVQWGTFTPDEADWILGVGFETFPLVFDRTPSVTIRETGTVVPGLVTVHRVTPAGFELQNASHPVHWVATGPAP